MIFSHLILKRAHPLAPRNPTRWREGCGPLSCRGNTWLKQLDCLHLWAGWKGSRKWGWRQTSSEAPELGGLGSKREAQALPSNRFSLQETSPSIPSLTLTLPHLVGERVGKSLQSRAPDEHARRVKDTRGAVLRKRGPQGISCIMRPPGRRRSILAG